MSQRKILVPSNAVLRMPLKIIRTHHATYYKNDDMMAKCDIKQSFENILFKLVIPVDQNILPLIFGILGSIWVSACFIQDDLRNS